MIISFANTCSLIPLPLKYINSNTILRILIVIALMNHTITYCYIPDRLKQLTHSNLDPKKFSTHWSELKSHAIDSIYIPVTSKGMFYPVKYAALQLLYVISMMFVYRNLIIVQHFKCIILYLLMISYFMMIFEYNTNVNISLTTFTY